MLLRYGGNTLPPCKGVLPTLLLVVTKMRAAAREVWERMSPADREHVCAPCWVAGRFTPSGEIDCSGHWSGRMNDADDYSRYWACDGIVDDYYRQPPLLLSYDCRKEWLCECLAAQLLVPWAALTRCFGTDAELGAIFQVEPYVIRFRRALGAARPR